MNVQGAVVSQLPYLFAIAYNLFGNVADAEDASQETACKFLRKNPRVSPDNLRAYLGKMVVNHCLDQLKKKYKPVSLESVGDIPAPDFQNEPDEDLGRWLAALAPKDRLVIDLFYREELALEEIANILGDTINAVKVRLHRARKNLRRMAGSQGVVCGREK